MPINFLSQSGKVSVFPWINTITQNLLNRFSNQFVVYEITDKINTSFKISLSLEQFNTQTMMLTNMQAI